ncbi:MAG TPA: hypothetical protein VFN67_10580 [Polyangiales bacterium]|nr:hypothetical protein [Polyangiales bacterium]
MGKTIPVILGEFAVTRRMKVMRQPEARIAWMESVAKACMSPGMAQSSGTPLMVDVHNAFTADLERYARARSH